MVASPHPVRLVVRDDLERNRLTVLLRLLLAIPHYIWATLWTFVVVVTSFLNWLHALAAGRPAGPLHGFAAAYVRYLSHLNAYLWLAANPYPGFLGEEGSYPIDVRLPGPQPQERWKTLVRILLAVPALLLSTTLGGGGSIRLPLRGSGSAAYGSLSGGLSSIASFLGWFASLARGEMPRGLRDATAYSVGYTAQLLAYVLLVTDRYPDSDPTQMLASLDRPPLHPVRLTGEAHDLRRSRALVLFRIPLAIPHLVWLTLWGIAVYVAVFLNWFATLFSGRPAEPLHRFTARYVRYVLHVYAFLFLAANPFPGFVGERGYPLDLELPPPEPQNRWITGFRVVLVIPALALSAALFGSLWVGAFLTWWVALVTGEAPWGIRNLLAYALRYQAQYNAYAFLLTDRYPHASPLEGAEPEQQFELEPA
jgi:hypothetical protein